VARSVAVRIGSPPVAGFPDASNTPSESGGVLTYGPAGARLTSNLSATTHGGFGSVGTLTFSDELINSDLVLNTGSTAQLTFQRCKVNGHVDADQSGGSITLIDCDIDAGTFSGAAIGYQNVTLTRCQVRGGGTSFNMSRANHATDCWFHSQYLGPTAGTHNNGVLCSGNGTSGAAPIDVEHCTVACDTTDNGSGGGPTGPVALFGDFDHLSNITVNNCKIVAGDGGFGAALGLNVDKPFGSDPTNITYTNNVHTRRSPGGSTGVFGTTTAFLVGNGNVFTGNTYDDGTPLSPNV
jgi:hypothetical protein